LRSYRIVGKTRVYSNWNSIASKIITNVVYNNLVQSNAVYGKYAGLKVEILDETEEPLVGLATILTMVKKKH